MTSTCGGRSRRHAILPTPLAADRDVARQKEGEEAEPGQPKDDRLESEGLSEGEGGEPKFARWSRYCRDVVDSTFSKRVPTGTSSVLAIRRRLMTARFLSPRSMPPT